MVLCCMYAFGGYWSRIFKVVLFGSGLDPFTSSTVISIGSNMLMRYREDIDRFLL